MAALDVPPAGVHTCRQRSTVRWFTRQVRHLGRAGAVLERGVGSVGDAWIALAGLAQGSRGLDACAMEAPSKVSTKPEHPGDTRGEASSG